MKDTDRKRMRQGRRSTRHGQAQREIQANGQRHPTVDTLTEAGTHRQTGVTTGATDRECVRVRADTQHAGRRRRRRGERNEADVRWAHREGSCGERQDTTERETAQERAKGGRTE